MNWSSSPPENASAARATMLLGASLCISFILLVVAGALPSGSWLPMINVIACVFIPIGIVLADSVSSGSSAFTSYDETKAAWNNFGSCFFGTVLASFVGLPCVLLHAGAVDTRAFALWIASTIVTMLGAVYYWQARGKSFIR